MRGAGDAEPKRTAPAPSASLSEPPASCDIVLLPHRSGRRSGRPTMHRRSLHCYHRSLASNKILVALATTFLAYSNPHGFDGPPRGGSMDFIFMLTRDDQTVEDALDVLDAIRPLGLRHIGFKDVGVAPEVLQAAEPRHQGAGRDQLSRGGRHDARGLPALGADRGGRSASTGCSAAPTPTPSLRDPRGQRHRATTRSPAFPTAIRPCSAAGPRTWRRHCEAFVAKGCAGVDLLAYRATEAEPLDLVRAARRALGDRHADRRRQRRPAGAHRRARRCRRRCLHDRLGGVQRRLLAAQGRPALAAARRAGRLRLRRHDRRRRHRHPEPEGGGDRRRSEAAWPGVERLPAVVSRGRAGPSRIRGCGRRRWRRPSAARSRPPGTTPRSVRALGICGQLDGCVAVDREGQPLGPCIIWMDRRAEAEVAGLPAERVQDATGRRPGRHAHGRQGPLAEAPRARAGGDPPLPSAGLLSRGAADRRACVRPRPRLDHDGLRARRSAASMPGCWSCSSSRPGSCRRSPRPPIVRERCTGRAPR